MVESKRVRKAGSGRRLAWLFAGATSACGIASCGGNDDGQPVPAKGQVAALPSCAELVNVPAYGIAGSAGIVSASSRQIAAQAPLSIGTPATGAVPRYPPTATFCQVDIKLSHFGDTKDGYGPGEAQAVNIRIALPEKTNYKQRLMVQGGSGAQGTVEQTGSYGEGANYEALAPFKHENGK